MSKAKTATDENNDAEFTDEATETAATDERAASGTSIPAQCKQLVLAIAAEIKEKGSVYTDTIEWLNSLADEIRATQSRGLAPADKLLKLQGELDEVYASCATVADVQEPDTQAKIGELAAKINSLQKRIAATAETAPA